MKKAAHLFIALAGVMLSTAAMADSANWQGSVSRLIASHQVYPRSAQLRGEQGTTKLRFVVAPTGDVSQVQIIQSSGSAILDREAQSVISGLGRLPAPPSGISSLVVPIVWRLN